MAEDVLHLGPIDRRRSGRRQDARLAAIIEPEIGDASALQHSAVQQDFVEQPRSGSMRPVDSIRPLRGDRRGRLRRTRDLIERGAIRFRLTRRHAQCSKRHDMSGLYHRSPIPHSASARVRGGSAILSKQAHAHGDPVGNVARRHGNLL